ncbi:DUF3489 domain-containing protein [Pseudohoeflea coraliihabitans]|uniref:DUF3489 domain-containing protein n=1 Tax=Pseudohoeflea coraliihabitans TaxID=2860393 RepID=UPI0032047DB3
MTVQIIKNTADVSTVADGTPEKVCKLTRATKSAKSGKSRTKTKQDQLVALLSKPNGVRISVISDRLGWQSHTVRAAISSLRKKGHAVVSSKSPKSGELVYAISAKQQDDKTNAVGASS